MFLAAKAGTFVMVRVCIEDNRSPGNRNLAPPFRELSIVWASTADIGNLIKVAEVISVCEKARCPPSRCHYQLRATEGECDNG